MDQPEFEKQVSRATTLLREVVAPDIYVAAHGELITQGEIAFVIGAPIGQPGSWCMAMVADGVTASSDAELRETLRSSVALHLARQARRAAS